MTSIPPTPPPLLKYMRLVLCGALQLLETNGNDIRLVLEEKDQKSLIRALDAVEMGVFWVGTQIDDMIAMQDIKEMV